MREEKKPLEYTIYGDLRGEVVHIDGHDGRIYIYDNDDGIHHPTLVLTNGLEAIRLRDWLVKAIKELDGISGGKK